MIFQFFNFSIFKRVIFCAVFLSGFLMWGNASAATINVADYGDGTASLDNFLTAYAATSENDTILFPENGSATWETYATISKAITINGNGTTLTAGAGMDGEYGDYGFFNVSSIISSNLIRITEFTFQMTNFTPAVAIYVHDLTADNVRIDHNNFYHGSKAIMFYNPKGLIDNNHIYDGNLPVEYSAGNRTSADVSWVSLAAGTAEAAFIEDNHFIITSSYTGASFNEQIGTFNGGKLVIRRNTFDSTDSPLGTEFTFTPIMTHGSQGWSASGYYWEAGSENRRGQSVVEIYDNTMVGPRIDRPVIARGSANIIYNNTIAGTYNTETGALRYNPSIYLREEEYASDGGAIYEIHRTSWPAEDQIHNTFIWNNTYRNHDFNENIYGSIMATDELTQDKDYYLHKPCYSSDTEDGYGNTCTHGSESFVNLNGYTDGNGGSASYPAIDDGGLSYTAHGTMIFTATGDNAYADYEPYTYPHPLRTEAYDIVAPASPTGLSVQ